MSFLPDIRSKVKLQEGSTKRGISTTLTGFIVLYMVFKGQPVDFDTILQAVTGKVDFWVGVGLNVIGLLGIFIPDEPKTVKIELPPTELVSKSLSAQAPHNGRTVDTADSVADCPAVTQRLREPGLPARSTAQLERPANRDKSPPLQDTGWNG